MYLATGVEPTKLTEDIILEFSILSTICLSPLITLKTPSGRPASVNNSVNFIAQDGSFSDGFNINEFPHAIEIGHPHWNHWEN